MNRLIVMLLCICSTIVCACLAYLGFQAGIEAQAQHEPPEIRCDKLLERVPDSLYRLTLTDFKAGRFFVSYDEDENGEWERVYVPLFSSDLQELRHNYRAVIVCFADVANQDRLTERILAEKLDADYWYYSQSLDDSTYNQLAGYYNSMDFDRCVVLYAGFPRQQGLFGNVMLWSAAGGAGLSILVFGWQTISFVLVTIRGRSRDNSSAIDEEEMITTNRAGLPESDNND